MPTFVDEEDSTDLRPLLQANSAKFTPCRAAVRLSKKKVPGRAGKRTNGLNETSVEVLQLNASEFGSLSEPDGTE